MCASVCVSECVCLLVSHCPSMYLFIDLLNLFLVLIADYDYAAAFIIT